MAERLRRSGEVRSVLAHGRAVRGAHAVVRIRLRPDAGSPRWTVSASRRVGSAVDRNRAKRRLRAVMREVALPLGADVVVIARASAVSCGFEELERDVAGLIEVVWEEPNAGARS